MTYDIVDFNILGVECKQYGNLVVLTDYYEHHTMGEIDVEVGAIQLTPESTQSSVEEEAFSILDHCGYNGIQTAEVSYG